jgi:hypothetical protein
MKVISKIFPAIFVLIFISCNDKPIESQIIKTEYSIGYNGTYVTIYDDNDTIYLSNREDLIKIVSDKKANDSIRNTVKRHLNYRNLALIHSRITCGGGGTLSVSMNHGDSSLKIVQGGLESLTDFQNIAMLFLFLEKKHTEIDKAF